MVRMKYVKIPMHFLKYVHNNQSLKFTVIYLSCPTSIETRCSLSKMYAININKYTLVLKNMRTYKCFT